MGLYFLVQPISKRDCRFFVKLGELKKKIYIFVQQVVQNSEDNQEDEDSVEKGTTEDRFFNATKNTSDNLKILLSSAG